MNVSFKDLALKFKGFLEYIPDQNNKKEVHKEFAQKLIEEWLSELNLPKESIEVNPEIFKEIDRKYFYPYKLILDCKEAAGRISPSTWQAIEKRMFLPPDQIQS